MLCQFERFLLVWPVWPCQHRGKVLAAWGFHPTCSLQISFWIAWVLGRTICKWHNGSRECCLGSMPPGGGAKNETWIFQPVILCSLHPMPSTEIRKFASWTMRRCFQPFVFGSHVVGPSLKRPLANVAAKGKRAKPPVHQAVYSLQCQQTWL